LNEILFRAIRISHFMISVFFFFCNSCRWLFDSRTNQRGHGG
jgi:hypothetical protein